MVRTLQCIKYYTIQSFIIPISGNDTYLVFGTGELLSRVGLTGNDLHILVHQPNTVVLGVDFDYQ